MSYENVRPGAYFQILMVCNETQNLHCISRSGYCFVYVYLKLNLVIKNLSLECVMLTLRNNID